MDGTFFFDFLVALGNLFVFCFLGAVVTDNFSKLPDIMYETKWYRLPPTIQKHYILIMANMQRPHVFDGFHVVCLDLDRFTKVCVVPIHTQHPNNYSVCDCLIVNFFVSFVTANEQLLFILHDLEKFGRKVIPMERRRTGRFMCIAFCDVGRQLQAAQIFSIFNTCIFY